MLQVRPLPSHAVGELTLKIHSVLSSAEAQLASHPAPQALRDALEKLVLTRLHDAVFAAGEGDAKSDAALHEQLARLRVCESAWPPVLPSAPRVWPAPSHELAPLATQPLLTPVRLGVAAPFCHAPVSCWEPAVEALRRLDRYRAPKDKVRHPNRSEAFSK